ncbi:HNH endonuclease signature motif containing protein [Cryobacterium luteum]|uniref:HNH endonuclease n=1 Tax=Cryobacterium luteum TaxID=1424661 RepID=A0A1H8KPA1_9MICO|nr:HNH endonuclease signature motif containing protein [Cryobacterium luteum]TFB95057.1 HNH endonuclease [Cryobacterium luteum]SEN94729.1 protein of unknown function [Cryobacterium luteum]
MNNLADELRRAADRVASLGDCSAAFDALPEADVLAGQHSLAEARRLLDVFAAWMAGTVARRSRPELGREGLAARQGFATPEAMVQHVNGSSRGEAVKLVASGVLMGETDAAEKFAADQAEKRAADLLLNPSINLDLAEVESEIVEVPWQAPIVHAVAAGSLTVDQADALRCGLGEIDQAVSAQILRDALTELVPEVTGLNVELVYRRARRLRDQLDEAGVRAREKQARDDTRFKVFRRQDGMVVLSGLLAPEQGEYWISAYECLTSPRLRGGVRFVDPDQEAWADRVRNDPRTVDQIAADCFTALLKTGTDADPTKMYGGRQPAVRIVVTQADLQRAGLAVPRGVTVTVTGADAHSRTSEASNHTGSAAPGNARPGSGAAAATPGAGSPAPTEPLKLTRPACVPAQSPQRVGHGFLEGNPAPISLETVQKYLCDTGQLRLLVDEAGHPLKLGRTVRTFSEAQRVAMGVRDGGCMFPGCDLPPSRTEAHHADQWVRDTGETDIDRGLLFCGPCHRRLHQEGWRVIGESGAFWLQPPATIDPTQTLIPLASKSPLMLELQRVQDAEAS